MKTIKSVLSKHLYILLIISCSIVNTAHSIEKVIDTSFVKSINMGEVEIYAKSNESNIKSGSSGLNISIKDIKQLPRFVGESDPYKALQYLGGVSQTSEANSGLYVRGGNNDQNLILLNGAPIQNPTHVLGMFSIFNPDIITQMKFFKSGVPAEYGGKLSSVVDITTNNYIPEKKQIDGTIGIISSKLSCSIPMGNRLAIHTSLRGSYLGLIVLPTLEMIGINKLLTSNRYDFWDSNIGFTFKLSKLTILNSNFYKGEDKMDIKDFQVSNIGSTNTSWGNTVSSLQLNHIFSQSTSTSHSLVYSSFKMNTTIDFMNSYNQIMTESKILNYKGELVDIRPNSKFKAGIEFSNYHISPNKTISDSTRGFVSKNENNVIHSNLITAFIRDEFTINKFLFNVGLRFNTYMQIGPYQNYIDSTSYKSNSLVKKYITLEPRFFCRYLINESSSIKCSASKHDQFLSQMPILAIGIPADLQMPASLYVKPQTSWHYSLGYYKNFDENTLETSLEGYYKTLENQVEFKNAIQSMFFNEMLEKSIISGRGWAYGVELKLKKEYYKLSVWLTYNLAWSYRQFNQMNGGNPFLAYNDRRHDISIILTYKFNNKLNFSALFVYATGNRVNLPVSWFPMNNTVVFEYLGFNQYAMPAYNRLDLGLNYLIKSTTDYKSEINISIYNAYNRANPFELYLGYSGNSANNQNFIIKKAYLLPIVPSISWIFRF